MQIKRLAAAAAAGVCLLLHSVLLTASAETEKKSYDDGMFTFTYVDGGVELSGINETALAVSLPSETDGRRIIGIADGAFFNCSKLQSVHLPDGLKYIGRHAFSGCEQLTKIEIPDSVETLGANAFSGCVLLEQLHLPEKITEIPEGLCYTCVMLKDVNLPDSVTKIGDEAFYSCSNLQTADMPDHLTELGNYAFAFTGLNQIDLPDSVKKLSGGTFCGCDNITEFVVPQQMEDLGSLAFMGCTGLSSFDVEEGNLHYSAKDGVIYKDNGSNLFLYPAGNPQTEFTVPEGVNIINDGAFFKSEHLTQVNFPSTLRYIGAGAFEYCIGLKHLSLPEGTELIYENAFADCSELYAADLPSTLRGVGNYAFYNCPKLMTVTVPAGCRTVGENAFGYIEQVDAEGNASPVKLKGFKQVSGGFSIWKILAVVLGVAAGGALIMFLVSVIRKNQMTAQEHEDNVIADENYTGITQETDNSEQEDKS
ncbi:MAG: leucine-rich repeat domain-containing protein [Oscillospiraceae bacterium]|nr:leucine-rich repeat domain-containing protein [Oscillospiraceae bacterium]